jgi:hypothetical protein
MTHTTKRQPKASTKHHPEYETIGREVDLGIAILIAETEDGRYAPTGRVATINEAIECASHDMACRMRNLELGAEPTYPRDLQGLVPRLRRPVRHRVRNGRRLDEADPARPEETMMPAPAPYRLYDARRREVIDGYLNAAQAREEAARPVAKGECDEIEIQHLEDGLSGYDYHRIDSVASEAEW